VPAVPIYVAATTTSAAVDFDIGTAEVSFAAILGFAATETTGSAAASFRLYDGTDTSGLQLCPLQNIPQGVSQEPVWFGDEGVQVQSGSVYLSVVSGSVELVIYAVASVPVPTGSEAN